MGIKIIKQDFERIRYFLHPLVYGPPVLQKVNVDIVFCIDCTNGGALVHCMENRIVEFLEALNAKERDVIVKWRARAVGYGNLDIGEPLMNRNEFVCDADSFAKQLAGLEELGYADGDDPKSTLDAICYAAETSDWREECHKVIIVLTDAPTKELHESTKSVFGIINVDELKWDLVEKHIKLFLWGPKDTVYESFNCIPKSEIIQLDDAHEALCSGKIIDLMKYLDWIYLVLGCFHDSNL